MVAIAAQPAVGARSPKWTAEGAITALRMHSITVRGHTCQITAASPGRQTLRLFYVGAEAKIACVQGVLRSIDVLKAAPSIQATEPAPNSDNSGVSQAAGGDGQCTTSTDAHGHTFTSCMTRIG